MIHSCMYLLIHKTFVICYVSLPVRLGRVNRKWYWQKKWFMVGMKKGEVAEQSVLFISQMCFNSVSRLHEYGLWVE